MNGELRALSFTAAELLGTRELFRAAFPKAAYLDEAMLEWQYRANPEGQAVGFNAWAGGVIAAHYATQPMVATLRDRKVRGLLSLNTATHPAHQGQGLFTRAAEATYQRGRELGFEFVIGVANANSTPVMVRKLGFQRVAPLDAKLGFGAVARRAVSREYEYRRVWSDEALRWRLENPNRRYRLVAVPGGVRVEAPTGRAGIQAILATCDASAGLAPTEGPAPKNPLKVWLGLDANADWAVSRYGSLPMQLRPSPLNLVWKDLTGAGLRLDADTVRFDALDFDAY
jgi:GNAT superfamily N-acetyltransferase